MLSWTLIRASDRLAHWEGHLKNGSGEGGGERGTYAFQLCNEAALGTVSDETKQHPNKLSGGKHAPVETAVGFVMAEPPREISTFLPAWRLTPVMRNAERASAAQTLGTVCVFGS